VEFINNPGHVIIFFYFSIMKTIHVTAAVILDQGKILCVQRGENKYDYISKKWEFPGGKVEEGESIESCVVREIKEELKLEINVLDAFVQVDHQYPDFRIIMDAFLCEITEGNLVLTEHVDFKWLKAADLNQLDWAAADIPIVQKLMKQ